MAAVLPYVVFVFFSIAILHSEGAQSRPFIITEPSVVGWKGDDIKLPCNFSGDPYAVFWVKLNGTDLNNKENKAGLFNGFIRSFDERFKMDDDFTLVIRDLQVSDEGEYLCQLEREDHSDEDSLTNLHIYAKAGTPVIKPCNGSTECTLRTPPGSLNLSLDCKVTGFKPNLTALFWSTAGRDLTPVKDAQTRLTDGTWERVVTITAKAKNGPNQNFTCTATGVAVGGLALATITVLPLQGPSRMGAGAIAGIIIAIILIVVIIVGFLVWNLRRGEHNANDSTDGKNEPAGERHKMLKLEADGKSEPSMQDLLEKERVYQEKEKLKADINELQMKIKEYKPGKAADVPIIADYVSKVNISLFGLMGAGKSSFFNSLNFAVKGKYKTLSMVGSNETSGAMTALCIQHPLAPCVNLNDNRGMRRFDLAEVAEFMAQARGERGVDPKVKVHHEKANEIHCIVFVHHYSSNGWKDAREFIATFFDTAFQHYGRPPLFVFTHGNGLGRKCQELKLTLDHYRIPEENIFVFENYTPTEHEEDEEKHLELLKFVWNALEECDFNIHNMETRRAERIDHGKFRSFLGY